MDTPEELLRDIQQSLTDAYAEPVASERRRSFAHHATTQASDLIMRDESTPEQRKQGSAYLEQSLALQAEFEPAQRVRPHQMNRRAQQQQGPSVASLLDAIADHSNKTPLRRAPVCHEPAQRQETAAGHAARQEPVHNQLEA